MPTPEPQQQPINLFGNLTKLPFDQFGNVVTPVPSEQPAADGTPVMNYASGPANLDDPFARRPEKEEQARVNKTATIPALLLALGWAAYMVQIAWTQGVGMLMPAQAGLLLLMGMKAVFSFVVCLLAAPLVGATIGNLGTAFIRIAAVVIFPAGVSLLIPYVGEFVLQPVLCWALLAWFFELDLVEGFILSQILWVSHFIVIWLLGMWGMMVIFH